MWYFRVVRKSQARASGADLGIVNIIIIIIVIIIISIIIAWQDMFSQWVTINHAG